MDYLKAALEVATVAGFCLKENFYKKRLDVTFKDSENIVTVSDYESERIILEMLTAYYPDHDYFSEEAGSTDKNALYKWFIDPLDGTTNFSNGLPHFCVSIALYQRLNSGKYNPCLGVVYDPMHNELFFAESGSGAYCDGNSIAIWGHEDIKKSVIVLSRGGNRVEKMRAGLIFSQLVFHVRSLRVFNASALDICHVAAGRFDAFAANGCAFHDCAAGAIIAREAGALITDFQGNEWQGGDGDIIVSNPVLLPQLVEVLKVL